MSIRLLFAATLLGACVTLLPAAQEKGDPDQKQKDAVKKELDALQGTWNFVTVELAGVKQPRQKRGEPFQTITFRGDKFEVKRGEAAIRSGTVKIDPTRKPKTLDLTVAEGEGKGAAQLGIYELEGNTFKLCLDPEGKKRPAEFQSTEAAGYSLAVLQREKGAGVDPNDASIVYDRVFQMNSGFKAYNGRAYDVAALAVGPKAKLVLPDKATVVEKHDQEGVVLICMEKRASIGAHFTRPVSVADYRKKMGCAVKLEKGSLLVGTFGEFGFLEGSVSMRLLVLVPPKAEVERRAGLIGGYGGRAGSERPASAINPTRDDPKPALTKSKEGTPPRWLPPAEEDGWHEIPSAPDAERRAGKAEEKKEKKR